MQREDQMGQGQTKRRAMASGGAGRGYPERWSAGAHDVQPVVGVASEQPWREIRDAPADMQAVPQGDGNAR